MLKLKPQYFGHLMWRADSQEKTLMLRKIEGTSLCQEIRSPEREVTILEGVINTYTQKEVSLLLNNVGENKTLDTQVIKWTSSW